MSFTLHPHFSTKHHLIDLPLCSVYLENNADYPWLLLIPRRNGAKKMIDLSLEDQTLLFAEMVLGQTLLSNLFTPTQINIAAIGNKTPQLHIHIIARYENDPTWPGTVWDHATKRTYSEKQLKEISMKIQRGFQESLQLK